MMDEMLKEIQEKCDTWQSNFKVHDSMKLDELLKKVEQDEEQARYVTELQKVSEEAIALEK